MPSANAPATTLASRGSGVYLAVQDDIGATPRQLVIGGKRLSRFMDSIYLDRPCEKLDVKKIQVLNEARRPLLDQSKVGSVNARVRSALARGLRAAAVRNVLEWGCGYHPMRELLADVGYAGLDVDPHVVAWNREQPMMQRCPVYEADRELKGIGAGSREAIVSSFVFHFRVPRVHVATMRRALTPDGIVLANVYRRSARSRRQLVDEFEQAGFRVRRMKDPAELCVDHEFWCLTVADGPDSGRDVEALTAVAAAVAAD